MKTALFIIRIILSPIVFTICLTMIIVATLPIMLLIWWCINSAYCILIGKEVEEPRLPLYILGYPFFMAIDFIKGKNILDYN